ncbi:MAG TPA: ABC transporter permease subunit [Solirubrobacteraceae bacterium]|nr:ABC transporter permease subunit [Solirubrobacteraceae bacterium]
MSAAAPASPVPARRRPARRLGRRLAPVLGLLPLVVGLACWELFGDKGSPTFPPPSTWWDALRILNDDGTLMPAIGETLKTFAVALAVATAIGVALGIAIGMSRIVDRALGPLLEFFRIMPPPAIIPVAVLVIGTNLQMKVLVVVLACVWPILLNTTSAVRAIPPVRIAMARSLRLSNPALLRKVIVPSTLPGSVLGLRVATPLCFIVTLVVEMLASSGGVGQLILLNQRNFNAQAVFGLLVVIALLGLALSLLIAATESRALRRWPVRGS